MILFLIAFANTSTHLFVHSKFFLNIKLLNYDSNDNVNKEKIQFAIESCYSTLNRSIESLHNQIFK